MAGNIKGITIEIGGDTTKLDRALKQANKTSRDLSKQLRDINRELKFNPQSTELLAQKQRVLAESIDNTKRKLEALKKAQEQAAQALARGDISQGQYDKLAREVMKAESQLQYYEKEVQKLSKSEIAAAQASEERRRKLAELSKEHEKLKGSAEKLSKEYELQVKSLGNNAKESDKLKARQEYLAQSMTNSAKQVSNLEQQLSIAKKEYGANSVEVQKLENELLSAKIVAQDFANEYKTVGSSLYQTSQQFTKLGNSLADAGKTMTAKVTAPLLAIGTASAKVGMDFESQMSKVQAISGATGSDLQSLTNIAKEMGATTKFSATESAEGLTYMAMAGWKTQEMIAGLPPILNLAIASGEDLATTSDIVTDAITAFGLSAQDAGRFSDVLAAASNNANTNVAMLGESFKYVAPVAGALGYSVEDVAVALGLMANAGIKSSQAGTTLKTSLANMAKPTKEVEAGMQRVGLEIKNADGTMRPFSDVLVDMREGFSKLSDAEKVQTATMMFGKQAMAGMLAIINASDEDFQKLTNSIDNSAGSTERMAAIMSDNLKGSFDNMKSALESAGIAIAETLTPSIRALMDKVGELATSFKNLDPTTQQTIIQFAGLAAAIGPVLLIAGKLFGVLGTVTGALAVVTSEAAAASPAIAGLASVFGVLGKGLVALTSGPVGLVVAGLAGIGIAAVKLGRNLSEDAIPEVELFGEGVSEATEKAVGSFLELEESATNSLNQMLWSGSKVTQEYKSTIVDNFNQMKDQVVAALNEQKTEAGNVLIKMFEDMDDMSKEEKDRMLEITNQTFDERIQLITEGNERIKEIMELASAEKRELTIAEAEEIQRIQAELKDLGIQTLSETEQEYKVIRQRMADQGAEISAQGAAEIVKNSLEQKTQTINNAEEEYNQRIKLAEQIRAKGGKEAEASANKIIEEAKRQKDNTVKEATQMHDDVVKEAKAQAKEHANEVDWETGEILSKWGVFKGKMSSLAGDISSNVSSEWTRIKENTSESWNNAKQSISEAMTSAQEVAGRLSESIKKSVGDKWDSLKKTTSSKWENIRNSMVKSMENAKVGIGSALKKMRDLFKFEWSLPKIKLPHFRKTGSKTIGPLTVPTFGVEWYKKGAIFNKPTLFNTPYGMKGVGEAGAEAVLPIEKLSGIMAKTLSDLGYNSNSFDEMKLAFNEMKNGGLNWANDTSLYKEPKSIRAEQDLKEIKDLLQNLDKPLNINIDGRTIARVLAPLLNEELSFDNKRRMRGLGLA